MTTEHSRVARWQGDLLPHIVDRLARETPEAIYGLWPVASASYDAGVNTVTYAQLANVVNGLSWWLKDQLGPAKSGGELEVLTYVGPNDVRLTALLLAGMKAGYGIFLTSPRNSPAAHRSLFEKLNCCTLVTTDPAPPPVAVILEAVQPRKLTAPSVSELLDTPYPPYTYTKTLQEARGDPFFIIHTSGSTGIPKPLIWTQEAGARHQNLSALAAPEGVMSIDSFVYGKRVMATVPPFHGAGLAQYVLNAIPFGNVVIVPAAAGIATAQGLVDALQHTPADVAVLVPSLVVELAQNPALLDYCAAHLELILYIGGDLPQAIGDLVAAKVRLRCQWGASETGIPQQLMPAELAGPSDWRYVRFHPSVGAVFEEVAEGVFEFVIRRDDALAAVQPVFAIRGQDQLREYRTRDLFSRHPTVPDAWCWRGRTDDIIVFLNGEKTNPVSMEQHIVASNPALSGALVIGAQRFQAALLIEPAAGATGKPLTTADQAALIEQVWPSVEEANRVAPAHARVEKSLILVTTTDRPLIRAGKGTIQRSASLAQYAAEIDKLYVDADVDLGAGDDDDSGGHVPRATAVNTTDASEVTSYILESIRDVTGWSKLDETSSFFDFGMDSLQALQLTRALRRGLFRHDLALPTIYQYPSVRQLTAALMTEQNGVVEHESERDMMESLLSTYRDLIQQIPAPKISAPGPERRGEETVDIILTGSTGTIGTFVLQALLERPGIGHIFCLNRSADGGYAVQVNRFAAAGLDPDILGQHAGRATFLHSDLAMPSLGLDKVMYETLSARVQLIIHNAWPVNFNLGLAAFRPQLSGLVNLFTLAAGAAPSTTTRMLFISSVGAVSGRGPAAPAGPAPEMILDTLDMPHGNGYSRSKFLSELLCDAAARHLGIPVAIARVGQVAGSVRAPGLAWNHAEWLPSLVISSFHLGCVPDSLGPMSTHIDWMPSDMLGDVVTDLGAQLCRSCNAAAPGTTGGAEVFNLRNPHTTEWKVLLPSILDVASARLGHTLKVVSTSAWLARLQETMVAASGGSSSDLAAAAVLNPAIKLIDFYSYSLVADEGAARPSQGEPMAVERALATSRALRDMPAVGTEWMRKWVEEWIAK